MNLPIELQQAFCEVNATPVAFYPIYVKITGRMTSGVLLSQLMYWYNAVKFREFYKTDAEIMQETSLSRHELNAAKKALKDLGLCDIKAKGIPAKTYYRPNVPAIVRATYEHGKATNPDAVNQAFRISENCGSEIRKTLTENTTENTAKSVKERTPEVKKTNEQPFDASEAIASKMLNSTQHLNIALMKLAPELHRPAIDELPKFGAWWLSKNAATFTDAELRDYVKRLNPANLWARWASSWAPNLKPAGTNRFKQPEPPRPARPVFM